MPRRKRSESGRRSEVKRAAASRTDRQSESRSRRTDRKSESGSRSERAATSRTDRKSVSRSRRTDRQSESGPRSKRAVANRTDQQSESRSRRSDRLSESGSRRIDRQSESGRRSVAERATSRRTDGDSDPPNGAPSAAGGPAQVLFSDNEEDEEMVSVKDEEKEEAIPVADFMPVPEKIRKKLTRQGGRRRKLTPEEEEYTRVSAELAEFDYYVPVSVRKERSADDPVVGTVRLTLRKAPSQLPRTGQFWVYVSESEERAVLYYEWLASVNNASSVIRVQLIEAEAPRPADLWSLLDGASRYGGASRGVETVLRAYSSSTGELQLDLLFPEKAIVPLGHPSEIYSRMNADCRALLRRLRELPGQEYTSKQLAAVDVEALYRRMGARRGEDQEPDAAADSEPAPDPQHEHLLPKLRPYQCDAVRWMLKREQRPLADSEELHELYVPLTLGGRTVYYCPLGGWAVRERPVARSSPPGGILADEMGLGKTVEILSLVLNHPRSDVEVPEPMEIVNLVANENDVPKHSSQSAEEDRPEPDQMDGTVEAVVRECHDGEPPRSYQPNDRPRKKLKPDPDAPLPEMSACRDQRPDQEKEDDLDPTFSCLCGPRRGTEHCVQCGACGTFQHARCVGYNVDDPLRGPYYCPQCWTKRPPVRSGATLIISPAAISDQWVEEIHKHIRRDGLRVMVYTGISSKMSYIQPQRLATPDLVVTTYSVLQKEINYTELRSSGEAGKRRQTRYLEPPSPLLCVDWWRVCLDEAQMVENTTSRTAAMALKLHCVNRWCVTGTPISYGVGDLYGLLHFLGEDPFCWEMWWNQMVYYPYLHGDSAPLDRLLERVLWRTAKADVLHEIGLPEQREIVVRLDFSPVEAYFYRRQHEECARDALAKLTKFSDEDDSLRLEDLEWSTANEIFYPLLRLRQACCHPQVVRGQFTPVKKRTLTMGEVLRQLIRGAAKEAQEAQRKCTAAQNGLAALHVARGEWTEAAELYRTVLRQAEELKGTLSTDMLQRLHAANNLNKLVSAGRPIPATTSDHKLKEEVAALRAAYVGKRADLVQKAVTASVNLASEVDAHAERLDEHGRSWLGTVLSRWSDSEARPGEVLERINSEVKDLSSADPNIENRADTDLTKRTTGMKSRAPANTILKKFSSVRDLQKLLSERLTALAERRKETRLGVGELVDVPPANLVKAAVECHLRPNNKDADLCRLCVVPDLFERYERELFYADYRGESETERVLKVLHSQARRLGIEPPLVELGGHYIRMLHTMKEFNGLRILWHRISDRVSASDKVEMAMLRPITRSDDEPAPGRPVAQGDQQLPTYAIEPHEVDVRRGGLTEKKAAAEADLRRKLGQKLYLTNLKKAGTEHQNGKPDPCPICLTELGTNWSVLQCGHCLCKPCVKRIVEYSVEGRREAKCAICRGITPHANIAYVKATREDEDDSRRVRVRGSHSTKVEAVVRCVLTVLRDEPDAKTLVFAEWTDALDVIGGALRENDVAYRSLHAPGAMQKHVREFRTDPDISVLLLPIHSGASGLNLIEATHVILTNPLLDPGDERQAISRVHRIGQTRTTVVHRLIVRDTIEEQVLALNAARPAAAAEAVMPGPREDGLTLAEIRTLIEDPNTGWARE